MLLLQYLQMTGIILPINQVEYKVWKLSCFIILVLFKSIYPSLETLSSLTLCAGGKGTFFIWKSQLSPSQVQKIEKNLSAKSSKNYYYEALLLLCFFIMFSLYHSEKEDVALVDAYI